MNMNRRFSLGALATLTACVVGCGDSGDGPAPISTSGGSSIPSDVPAVPGASESSSSVGPGTVMPYTGGTGETSEVKATMVQTEMGETPLSYVMVDGRAMRGDMAFAISQEQTFNSAPTKIRTWTGGVVPLVIEGNLPDPTALLFAIAHWQQITGLRFVARSNQADYIRIFHGKPGECWSYVGRVGGAQDLSLGDGCTGADVAAHELGHAAGLFHEHDRADRDNYITIFPQNINPKNLYNFEKVGFQSAGNYDTSSLMHYESEAFANPGTRAFQTKDGKRIPRNATGLLTAGDLFGVTMLYKNEGIGGGTGVPQFRVTQNAGMYEYPGGRGDGVAIIAAGTVTLGSGYLVENSYAIYANGKPGWISASSVQKL